MKKIAKAIARGLWKLSILATEHDTFVGYINGKLYRSERKYDRDLRRLRRWNTMEDLRNMNARVEKTVAYPVPEWLR